MQKMRSNLAFVPSNWKSSADFVERPVGEDVDEDEEVSDDGNMSRAGLPMAFGKSSGKEARLKPSAAPRGSDTLTNDENYPKAAEKRASQDPEEDDIESAFDLPIGREAVLGGDTHRSSVTSIALDPSGSRMLTASSDYSALMYDFNAMTRELKSFRRFEPFGPFPIRTVDFSPTGSHVVVAGGARGAKLYDRDGRESYTCPTGDMYIRDMNNTVGHVSPLSAACFLYKSSSLKFATAAGDGTVRFWDATAEKAPLKHSKLFKLMTFGRARANDSGTTLCAGSSKGLLYVGCESGKLILLDPKSSSNRSVGVAEEATEEVTGMAVSSDETFILARSQDDCLRLWDARQLEKPMKVFSDLTNDLSSTGVCFSPGDEKLVTCVSVRPLTKRAKERGDKAPPPGKVLIFDRASLSQIHDFALPAEAGSGLALSWSAPLNQLFVGSASGNTYVRYSETRSQKGVLIGLGKVGVKGPRNDVFVGASGIGKIYTPNALPMFRDDNQDANGVSMRGGEIRADTHRRVKAKLRHDPISTQKPHFPSTAFDRGVEAPTLASYIAKQGTKATWMEEDARESLLKHAAEGSKNPIFTGNAYNETQPERLLAAKTAEQEADESRQRLLDRLPRHLRDKRGADKNA